MTLLNKWEVRIVSCMLVELGEVKIRYSDKHSASLADPNHLVVDFMDQCITLPRFMTDFCPDSCKITARNIRYGALVTVRQDATVAMLSTWSGEGRGIVNYYLAMDDAADYVWFISCMRRFVYVVNCRSQARCDMFTVLLRGYAKVAKLSISERDELDRAA